MNGFNPQWEFGHGLSYTKFDYTGFIASKNAMGGLEVAVTVTNSGEKSGKEVVQLYISDLVASITPSVKRLRGFDKVELEPGANKRVNFSLSKDDLSFVGRDNEWIFEPGEFKVMIAGNELVVEL